MLDHEIYVFEVLYLPSWFPGMSFKNEIEVARANFKQYLERPLEYSLSKAVSNILTAHLMRTLNDHMYQPSAAPSLVHDALRHMEEKGITPDESWMEQLKGASGTAFFGILLRCLTRSYADILVNSRNRWCKCYSGLMTITWVTA